MKGIFAFTNCLKEVVSNLSKCFERAVAFSGDSVLPLNQHMIFVIS